VVSRAGLPFGLTFFELGIAQFYVKRADVGVDFDDVLANGRSLAPAPRAPQDAGEDRGLPYANARVAVPHLERVILYVEASLDATTKAADGFTMPDLGNLRGQQAKISITNATNADAWPISTFTFLIVAKDYSDKGKAQAILRFAWWGTHEGQIFAKDLGYAPLPANVVKTAEDVLRSITSGGVKVLPQ